MLKHNQRTKIYELGKMLTAIIIVARVQPGTSKGITDLLLPPPYSGLKNVSSPSSFPPRHAEACASNLCNILKKI